MGERQGWLFEPTFNRTIKLRQADPRITSDAGALVLREVDHRLGLVAGLAGELAESRDRDRVRYSQAELVRQHVYGLAQGYAHQDDADRLAHDVAMKLAVWDRPGKRVIDERLASQSSHWRLMEGLSSKDNRRILNEALPVWVGRHQRAAGGGRKVTHGTLDIDPFPVELHGRQQGGGHNGYYGRTMYYPIAASFSAGGSYESARLGEGFVHAILRRGKAPGAEGAMRFMRESIRKARPLATHVDVRIDAGLTHGKVLDAIDDEGVSFVGRIKTNNTLEELAAPHLRRNPGRPTSCGDEFAVELGEYRAAGWTRPYRVVLVVIDLPDPETGLRQLFPRYFFLVTNWDPDRRSGWELVEHYRMRGTFEDRLGEFNGAIGSGLPAERFDVNEATLLVKLLAFNLAGMVRGELEDAGDPDEPGWDLRRVQQTVLKAGAKIVKHSNRIFVDVARAAAVLWRKLLARVGRWWLDPAWRRSAPRPRRWIPPPSHAHLRMVLRE